VSTAAYGNSSAVDLARTVSAGTRSARATVDACLAEIARVNPSINALTAVVAEAAAERADLLDQRVTRGDPVGPLAGVPFVVKNLLDVAGVTTLAGSRIHASNPPATRDATVVRRLHEAGAICVGAASMDEYAYGFTNENTWYGPCRNPHDLDRVAGGSSGGSAAAVAAGLVPFSLGTDTNGSIRVPATFCGVFGLLATYGRIPRAGAVLLAESLDRVGVFGRSVVDLAAVYDVLHGWDPEDQVSLRLPRAAALPSLEGDIAPLRVGVAGGHFARGGTPEVMEGLARVAAALGATRTIELEGAAKARAAAFIITSCEGSHAHLANLRSRPDDFFPEVRDRLRAGALVPQTWYQQAQKFRGLYRREVLSKFDEVDVFLAPTTPTPATRVGQEVMFIEGAEVRVRPNVGLYTQALSYIGLPIMNVPVHLPGHLPVGVMIVGPPHAEARVLQVARHLERARVVAAPIAAPIAASACLADPASRRALDSGQVRR
jgi:AtzE family amidohydrolase